MEMRILGFLVDIQGAAEKQAIIKPTVINSNTVFT
jgi:hypothetical protein